MLPADLAGIDFKKGFSDQVALLRDFLKQHGLAEGAGEHARVHGRQVGARRWGNSWATGRAKPVGSAALPAGLATAARLAFCVCRGAHLPALLCPALPCSAVCCRVQPEQAAFNGAGAACGAQLPALPGDLAARPLCCACRCGGNIRVCRRAGGAGTQTWAGRCLPAPTCQCTHPSHRRFPFLWPAPRPPTPPPLAAGRAASRRRQGHGADQQTPPPSPPWTAPRSSSAGSAACR